MDAHDRAAARVDTDPEINRLLDDYRRVNNDESLSVGEAEEALSDLADAVRERQRKILEEESEGHDD